MLACVLGLLPPASMLYFVTVLEKQWFWLQPQKSFSWTFSSTLGKKPISHPWLLGCNQKQRKVVGWATQPTGVQVSSVTQGASWRQVLAKGLEDWRKTCRLKVSNVSLSHKKYFNFWEIIQLKKFALAFCDEIFPLEEAPAGALFVLGLGHKTTASEPRRSRTPLL